MGNIKIFSFILPHTEFQLKTQIPSKTKSNIDVLDYFRDVSMFDLLINVLSSNLLFCHSIFSKPIINTHKPQQKVVKCIKF